MEVDSFKFLPRSFRPRYEHPDVAEDWTVWTPFRKRLADACVALLSSAGFYVEGEQPPFDAERERREPTWGDPSFRVIPHRVDLQALGMTHLHVNNERVLADPQVALPLRVLDDLVADGWLRSAADEHFAVMGFQAPELDGWRNDTAPAIVDRLRAQEADGVVLAPV